MRPSIRQIAVIAMFITGIFVSNASAQSRSSLIGFSVRSTVQSVTTSVDGTDVTVASVSPSLAIETYLEEAEFPVVGFRGSLSGGVPAVGKVAIGEDAELDFRDAIRNLQVSGIGGLAIRVLQRDRLGLHLSPGVGFSVLTGRWDYAAAFYYPGVGVISGQTSIGVAVISLNAHLDAIFDVEVAPNLAFIAGLDFAVPMYTSVSVITSSEEDAVGENRLGGFSLRSFVGLGYRSSRSET
jgi:hypothetical protein